MPISSNDNVHLGDIDVVLESRRRARLRSEVDFKHREPCCGAGQKKTADQELPRPERGSSQVGTLKAMEDMRRVLCAGCKWAHACDFFRIGLAHNMVERLVEPGGAGVLPPGESDDVRLAV